MITFVQRFRYIFQILYTKNLDKLIKYLKTDESSRFSAISSQAVQPAYGHAGHLHCLLHNGGSRDSSWQPPLLLPPQPDGQHNGAGAASLQLVARKTMLL